MRQRLSALEAAFLGIETAGAPFVYACILELDREVDVEALRAHIDAALPEDSRYRQRIAHRFLRRPLWVDDPEFRITRHVHNARVAAPGGTHELEALTAQLLGTELPRVHAPWRVWTVHGLAGGRGAVIAMVHHAMGDGLAGFRLLDHVLGGEPAPMPAVRPRPALRKLLTWRNVRALGGLLRGALRPASELGINPRHVERFRAVATHTVSLAAVHRIQDAFDVTINDVVLATVAGALRRTTLRHGRDPDDLIDVRAMVPVGRHAQSHYATEGNRIALLLAPLPVDEEDPQEAVERVARAMLGIKRGGATQGGDLLVATSELLGSSVLVAMFRIALRLRAFNTIVTNVPGPPAERTLLGARLTGVVPIVNLWPHEALGIAVASYSETLSFGLQADRTALPDLSAIRDDLVAAFDALLAASGAPHPAAAMTS
jgi:diacylglycerol O-acyltransferase